MRSPASSCLKSFVFRLDLLTLNGFSTYEVMKTKLRNRFTAEHVGKQIFIKENGPPLTETNFDHCSNEGSDLNRFSSGEWRSTYTWKTNRKKQTKISGKWTGKTPHHFFVKVCLFMEFRIKTFLLTKGEESSGDVPRFPRYCNTLDRLVR